LNDDPRRLDSMCERQVLRLRSKFVTREAWAHGHIAAWWTRGVYHEKSSYVLVLFEKICKLVEARATILPSLQYHFAAERGEIGIEENRPTLTIGTRCGSPLTTSSNLLGSMPRASR
jgi:hypothetical protein